MIVALIGLYCLLESISAAADMHGGDRLCRFLKFFMAAISGVIAIYHGAIGGSNIQMLVLITSVALGIWPRMVYRLFGGQRNSDKGRLIL
ncbi:MAG: hypothetical protein Q8M99_11935 [Methylotenera sp.]|nr:hypothetical protein [Methylotenera sp.]